MSRTGTKSRNGGQALVTSKPTHRNRKQEFSDNGDRAGKGVSGGAAAAKNDQNSSTKGVGQKYDDMGNKCHRWLEPRQRWFDCTAHVIPAAKKSQNGSGEIVACLANGKLGEGDAAREVAQCEQSKHGTEKWIGDSDATFRMTTSDDLLRDVRPSKDKVRISGDSLVDIQSYGSLRIVFPHEAGGVTLKLKQVAYLPELAFNLFAPEAAHNCGVGFVTDVMILASPYSAVLCFGVMGLGKFELW